ncbi:MAG: hypothetical protein M4D80_15035 [Myxococcota bacterium]|nr:hypothetical protein [Myxococcota bacterium]
MQCRLLQPPTATCAECGAPMTAPVELVRELLYYRDMNMLDHRDWGLLTAFLAGSSIALPILAPFAVGSIIALGIHKLAKARQRRAIAGVTVPPLPALPGATTLYGVARRFRGTVTSLVHESAPVLVEHAQVKDKHGAVLVRRTHATPFLLDVEGRGPVLVTGVTRVMAASILAQRTRIRRGDPRLEKMGVPGDFGIAGDLEIASIIADGPALAVTGVVEDEAVADMAFHREGGHMAVMRGKIGAPVLVEDRRLIAAAIL